MNLLEQIVDHKKEELASLKRERSISSFRDAEYFGRSTVSLRESLQRTKPFAIIAEIKRRSPSGGMLSTDCDPPMLAADYESHGAAGISVLTDERFFGGTIEDLQSVRDAVGLPVLRKDFILDEWQIHQSKSSGADAILLIAAILEKSHLCELFLLAQELGMECLVELYEKAELDKLSLDQVQLIGINNRDLRTLEVNMGHSAEMRRYLPKELTVVSESGISSARQIMDLKNRGFSGALIGELFMKSGSPGETLQDILRCVSDEAAG